MRQRADLVPLLDEDHRLPDRGGSRRRGIHADFDRIAEPLLGQLPDGRRHGRGKQERLPASGHFRHDPPQIVNEAHVQHAVGLVEDQDFDAAKIDEALLHEIQQPAGRGDEDIDAGFQRPDLRMLPDAAVDDRRPQPGVAAVGPEALVDLDRQLARGGKDQRRGVRRAAGAVAVLSRCIAGRAKAAVLPVPVCAAQHVAAFQNSWNGGGLDLGGNGVTLRTNRAEQCLGKAEFFKLHRIPIVSTHSTEGRRCPPPDGEEKSICGRCKRN